MANRRSGPMFDEEKRRAQAAQQQAQAAQQIAGQAGGKTGEPDAKQQEHAARLNAAVDSVETRVVAEHPLDPYAGVAPEQTARQEEPGRTPQESHAQMLENTIYRSMAKTQEKGGPPDGKNKPDFGYNEITVDFSSIEDNDTALYFATTLRGDSEKARFLDAWCDYAGVEPAELLEYGEALLDDKLFSQPAGNGAKSRTAMRQLGNLGLFDITGADIDPQTADFSTVVQGLCNLADEEKREEAAALVQQLTQTPGNAFYGQAFDPKSIAFRDSADLSRDAYQEELDRFEARFSADPANTEQNAQEYLEAYNDLMTAYAQNCHFRWYRYQHVYVIFTRIRFYDFLFVSLTYCS